MDTLNFEDNYFDFVEITYISERSWIVSPIHRRGFSEHIITAPPGKSLGQFKKKKLSPII